MIYISSGCVKNKKISDSITQLYKSGFNSIELSGGTSYYEDIKRDLFYFKKKGLNLVMHNYFPPPKESFVINLASLDDEVLLKSINHVKRAIEWTKDLGGRVFSFHAGFLLNPNVNELGQKILSKKLYDRKDSINKFIESVNFLDTVAKRNDIKLLIENNVISESNYKEFGKNPLLMVEEKEAMLFMESTSDNVNLLIDLAHLKVSSNVLGFDPIRYFKKLNKWIKGYHLSDNNGLVDSNEAIKIDSWFWKFLKKDIEYVSLEVYNNHIESLKKQLELINNKLF